MILCCALFLISFLIDKSDQLPKSWKQQWRLTLAEDLDPASNTSSAVVMTISDPDANTSSPVDTTISESTANTSSPMTISDPAVDASPVATNISDPDANTSPVAPTTSAQNSIALKEEGGVTQCIHPQANFFNRKKIRNGTLLLKCKPPNPYCDFQRNICVSRITTDIRCDVDGQFPHIADCRGYILCSKGHPVDHSCPSETSYDYQSKSCRKGRLECVIPNCKGKSNTYVRHPAKKRLFVLCLAGVPVTLYICPPSYVYSGKFHEPCDLECEIPGLYPDAYDKSIYYHCSYNGNMTRITMHCPSETEFDDESDSCI